MDRERVKQVLAYYRDIDGEIAFYHKRLKDYEDEYFVMSGGTVNESFINSRNKVSKPTETLMVNIPDSASAAMNVLRGRIEQLAALKAVILHELSKLSHTQKIILHDFYISNLKWVQISVRVNYGITQCKKMRNRALDILGWYFSQNELIENFSYPEEKSVR